MKPIARLLLLVLAVTALCPAVSRAESGPAAVLTSCKVS